MSQTHAHAHQRHDRKQEGYAPCNNVHNTSDQLFFLSFVFLRNYQNKCIRFEKKTTRDGAHLIKPTEEEERKKDLFTLSSQC